VRSLEPYSAEEVAARSGVDPERMAELAELLVSARSVVMVVVTGLGIPGDGAAVTHAAASLSSLVFGDGVLVLGEKANLQGALDMGLHPELLPGHRAAADSAAQREIERFWGTPPPSSSGWTTAEAFRRASQGQVGFLYLVGQDPVSAWPHGFEAGAALRGAGFVLVQDAFLTETARLADVVLPVSILGEREGTLVGADGIRREVRKVFDPPEPLPQDGRLLVELARRLGTELPSGARLEEEIGRLMAWPAPRVRRLRRFEPAAAPPPVKRFKGMLLDASPQLFRSGSATARSRQLQELDPSVALRLAPADAAGLGVASDEMVRVAAAGREILMRARLDPTVRQGTVVAPWHSGDSAATLVPLRGEPLYVEVRKS
jgi:predicted molibdopterin-dependent oxidoreductase YjgC